MLPHEGSVDGEQAFAGGKSGKLRAAIFGINDGLVSNVALIMGFAGADMDRSVILLAGISGLLAGAFSMGAGEYISMKVQREVLERMLHLEAHELHDDPETEREELAEIYVRKGLSEDLANEVSTQLMRGPGRRARHPRARGTRYRPERGPRQSLGCRDLVVLHVLHRGGDPADPVHRDERPDRDRDVGDADRRGAAHRGNADRPAHRPAEGGSRRSGSSRSGWARHS